MRLEAGTTDELIKRLRRVEGQIGGVIRMLEQGRDCEDIVTQLAAASRALQRAGFSLVSAGLRQCLTAKPGSDADAMTPERMEKLFLSLA
ncbi:MAG: metal-sensitive transcriptional regulator [Jatrophihabitans sp.]|uniref:metal-sensitive transcriptional regulator n=1 Tax=Jatrophihabitans sp. TaxID=1932789 RepID=UPI003F8213A8